MSPHQALSQRTQHSSFNEEKQLPISPVSPWLGPIYLLRHFCSPHARPRKIQLRHSCPPAAEWEALPLPYPPGWACKPVYFSIVCTDFAWSLGFPRKGEFEILCKPLPLKSACWKGFCFTLITVYVRSTVSASLGGGFESPHTPL